MLQLSETDSKGQKAREKERQKFESIVNEYSEYLEKNRTESGNGIVKETYGSRETEEKAKDYFEERMGLKVRRILVGHIVIDYPRRVSLWKF